MLCYCGVDQGDAHRTLQLLGEVDGIGADHECITRSISRSYAPEGTDRVTGQRPRADVEDKE
jgi:hypothetical protein